MIKMDPIKVELSDQYPDVEKKKIRFFDLLDITYHVDGSAIGFYYQYRNLVISSLKKKGDVIVWQTNLVLPADEELSPTFEEMILANVLGLINPLLPGLVRDKYGQVIGRQRGLMDFRTDILSRVPIFLTDIENSLQGVSEEQQNG
jgi:hypothetical protein